MDPFTGLGIEGKILGSVCGVDAVISVDKCIHAYMQHFLGACFFVLESSEAAVIRHKTASLIFSSALDSESWMRGMMELSEQGRCVK